MFKLNSTNLKSALVYGILTALVVVGIEVIAAKNIFALDWKTLVNDGVIAMVGVFVSLIKNFLTTNEGKFVGVVKVIPEVE